MAQQQLSGRRKPEKQCQTREVTRKRPQEIQKARNSEPYSPQTNGQVQRNGDGTQRPNVGDYKES